MRDKKYIQSCGDHSFQTGLITQVENCSGSDMLRAYPTNQDFERLLSSFYGVKDVTVVLVLLSIALVNSPFFLLLFRPSCNSGSGSRSRGFCAFPATARAFHLLSGEEFNTFVCPENFLGEPQRTSGSDGLQRSSISPGDPRTHNDKRHCVIYLE